MKNTKKKKIIIGDWVAEIDDLRTFEHNDAEREFTPDYTNKYPVWRVREYVDENGGSLFIADCGCHKNSEKNAKEIVESHNNKNNKR